MELTEITYEGQPPIEGYGAGFFRIMGQVYQGNLFVYSAGVKPWKGLTDLADIIANAADYDVVFIGMGKDIAPLPKAARKKLEKADVAFDVMSSPAACRTYNVLLSKDVAWHWRC